MIIYDRDNPRPYTSSDFPSSVISVMDPVLATESYVYAGVLVLADNVNAFGIRQEPDTFGTMRLPANYDATRKIISTSSLVTFDFARRTGTYRIVFSKRYTGEPIGHYPPQTALGGIPTSIALWD